MKKLMLLIAVILSVAPAAYAQGTYRNCLDITRAFGVDPSRCSPRPYYEPRGYRYGSYDDHDQYGRRRSTFGRVLEYGGYTAVDVWADRRYSNTRIHEYEAIGDINNRYRRPPVDEASVNRAHEAGYENAEQRAKEREAEIKRVLAERERQQQEAELERRKAELDRREANLKREENVSCSPSGAGIGRVRLQRQMREAVTVTWGKYSGPVNSLNFKDNGASACVEVQPGDPEGKYLVAHADGIYECGAKFRETQSFSDTFLITETDDEQADCVRRQ